ncbi:MAG: histidine kinase [Luteolibacter sp.]|uniref:histidine kinase n=1 Tax=Luteolibacter sp. TaxID=1962973 RepID=UPI0032638B26
MSCIPGLIGFLALSLSAADVGWADEAGWDVHLAERFSGRLKEIKKELATLDPQMKDLPAIPIDDQGGSGGYVGIYTLATPPANARFAVEVRWSKSAVVDLVALVPARLYDAKGLDAQYGLPDAFTVELLDAEGNVVRLVAEERNTTANPVRKGHPFLYQVSPPVEAVALRISAERLNQDSEGEKAFVHSWAEAMVFEGERNVALGAEVRSIGGGTSSAPWHWNAPFLVDGQTPLGLPEIPAEEHGNVGWMSEGREKASESASLYVDLGEPVSMDAVRLIPAKKPTSDLPSGWGFPKKLSIAVSDTGESGDAAKWTVISEKELVNPGHNPVLLGLNPVRARYVRIKATELWKAFDAYPAYFALSEVEILSGDKNLALGKAVSSPDGMQNLIAPGGRFWSSAALSDGYGPDGHLVSTREWLGQLDKRLQLESRRYALQTEAGNLVDGWRRTGQAGIALLVLGGAFLIIALPIRYRIHANRELVKVRERIAGDLHDEVGSNLGSIQMFADLAEGRSGPSSELKRIQRIAAETVSAVRDIVWLLRPSGDHRIGTVEHLRETASIMLETLDCKFSANEEGWQVELPEEANRDLFLYFREALHNIMRHAKAAKVEIRAEKNDNIFRLVIADDGVGIDPDRLERPATFRALRQRSEALSAELKVDSSPGNGTRLELSVPLERKRKRLPKFSNSTQSAQHP